MDDACDAIHANKLRNILFFLQSVPGNGVLLIAVELSVATGEVALTAATKAAKNVLANVEEEKIRVAVDERLSIFELRFEDVFGGQTS